MKSKILILDKYCERYTDNSVLVSMVREGFEWSTPGMNVLHKKVVKKMVKRARLIKDLGYYGPIIDLIIRSTIPEMIVMNFSKNPVEIVQGQGELYSTLIRRIKAHGGAEADAFIEVIDLWFGQDEYLFDYRTAYREKRMELITNQLATLQLNPSTVVSC